LIAIGGVAAIMIAAVAAIRRYPFEVFSFVTRRGLKKAGMQRKTIGDLVYWAGGKGSEPLVFVHGTNDQAGTWHQIIGRFLDRYRVIVPDLPGHGESEPLSGPLDMLQIRDGLTRIIAAETNGEKITLVGNSMGGWASMLYALDHPERVKKLILEDSGGMAWDLSAIPLVPETREQAAAAMRAVLGPGGQMPPAYVLDALVRRSAHAPMKRLLESDYPSHLMDERFDRIDAPVTMIWGEHDGLAPLTYARLMQSRLRNAELRIVKDCGHIPHRFKAEEFSRLVEEAIRV
jgi:pimeloyl-ACP methyl ester carboxylesterase